MENSINYLIEKINSDCLNSAYVDIKLLNKVKEMYREEIQNAYCQGAFDQLINKNLLIGKSSDKYYEDLYETKKSSPKSSDKCPK